MNLRVLHALPNYLTGFGILGTFAGLAAGIFVASAGMTSDDSEVLRQALQGLLSGAGLAFSTSICGLLSSIVLSWSDRWSLRLIDSRVEEWNTLLDALLRRSTPEQLAANQLEEMRKQTLQLERFNTDLAVSIADALHSKMSETLTPQFGQLLDGLHELRGQQAEFSNEVLERVSRELAGSLSGAAGNEMREMAATLNGLVGVLRDVSTALQDGQRRMLEVTEGAVGQMRDAFNETSGQLTGSAVEAVREMLSRVEAAGDVTARQLRLSGEESSRRFSDTFTMLESGVERIEGSVVAMSGLLEKNGEMSDRMGALMRTIGSAHESFAGTAEPLERASQQLSAVGTALAERLQKLEGVAATLQSASAQLEAAQQQIDAVWRHYQERFENVDVSLEKAFAQVTQGIDGLAGRTKNYLSEVDQSLGESVQKLGGLVSELHDALEELVEKRGDRHDS